MTFKQKVLQKIYPVLKTLSQLFASKAETATPNAKSIENFYSLSTTLINGEVLNFESLKGKYVLIVNTASNCGYTAQYAELQQLYQQYQPQLQIIGFPSNNFKEQEKGSNEEIAAFCSLNYGVTFPLAKKSDVIKNNQQNQVFQWLSYAEKNGWNNTEPAWNFAKFLINTNGQLIGVFPSGTSPLNPQITQLIK